MPIENCVGNDYQRRKNCVVWVKGGNFVTYSSDIALLSTHSKIVPMNMGRSTLIAVFDI